MSNKLLTWSFIAWSIIAVSLAGCGLVQEQADGTQIISAEKVQQIDKVAAVAETAGALSLLFPGAASIGGLLIGAAGAWKKMKPQVEEAKNEADIATAAGEATAMAIEDFKSSDPEAWKKLEGLFAKYHGQSVENFYRAIRGLSLKQ